MIPLRIAHLSDLHYSSPTWSLCQFFSKRWLGNLNLLLSRKRRYVPDNLALLPALFKKLGVDCVVICGDVSTTSLRSEFSLAANFVKTLSSCGLQVVTIPGNHDQYTKKAFQEGVFYHYFPPVFDLSIKNFNLKDHGVCAKNLNEGWWLVALDTALATSLVSSQGVFSSKIEANLEDLLMRIPNNHSVILVNHFPFFQQESRRKRLVRGEALEALIHRFPKIKFYLHGHTHRQSVADLRSEGLPLILDSGSVSDCKNGSWNLIDISSQKSEVEVYHWDHAWVPFKKFSFSQGATLL